MKILNSQLNLNYQYTILKENISISLYKENGIYQLQGFKLDEHFKYSFDKFNDAKKAYKLLIKGTKFMKLENNKWVETAFKPYKQQIKLYTLINDKMKLSAIGLY
jgi:hypothetical protein